MNQCVSLTLSVAEAPTNGRLIGTSLSLASILNVSARRVECSRRRAESRNVPPTLLNSKITLQSSVQQICMHFYPHTLHLKSSLLLRHGLGAWFPPPPSMLGSQQLQLG